MLTRLGRPSRSTLLKRIRLVESLKEQGNTAFKEQRTDEAIQKYTEALEADPDNESIKAVLLSNRAAAHLRVRESPSLFLSPARRVAVLALALASTARAFARIDDRQLTPLPPIHFVSPGTPQAKNYDSAIADCSSCVSASPSYFKAFRTRARAHLAQEDFEAAVRDFKQAYELAPQGSNDEAALKREVRDAEAKLKKSKMKVRCSFLPCAPASRRGGRRSRRSLFCRADPHAVWSRALSTGSLQDPRRGDDASTSRLRRPSQSLLAASSLTCDSADHVPPPRFSHSLSSSSLSPLPCYVSRQPHDEPAAPPG